MGVDITKPHPYVVDTAFLGTGDHMSNFGLIGPLISLRQPKQIPVDVVIKNKKHTHT